MNQSDVRFRQKLTSIGILFLLCFLSLVIPRQAHAQDLTVEELKTFGYHLPSYMPTFQDLDSYQRKVDARQTLWIRWETRSGQSDLVDERTANAYRSRGTFDVFAWKPGIPYGVGPVNTRLRSERIWVVATTKDGEIRGVTDIPDSRVIRGEHLANLGGQLLFRPNSQLKVFLPDDPAITRIEFFQVASKDDHASGNLFDLGGLKLDRQVLKKLPQSPLSQ